MLKSLKIKSLFIAMSVLGSLTVFAQEQNVSDTELGQFADAYIEMQVQNQKSQQDMIAVIEDEGLKVERFNEIQQASMDPNQKLDATADEIKKHANATSKLEKMQPELEKKAIASIESVGISLQQFEALSNKIQDDQKLQQRVQAIIVERQGL